MASCWRTAPSTEVIGQSRLTTYDGERRRARRARCTSSSGKPGVDMVAPFGTSLHVSGRDAAALEAAIAPYRDDPRLDLGDVASRRSKTCSST